MPQFVRLDAGIRRITGELGGLRIVGLRFFYLDGLFASLSDNLVAGFLELFLLSYGASNRLIGLNASVANLCGAVAILPGALAISRVSSRKKLVLLTGGGISRISLLAIAAVPLVVGQSDLAILALVAFSALRMAMGNFCNPAWTSMVADLVPLSARPRYFGKRNVAIIAASIAAAPIAGRIVKSLSGIPAFPHLGFQAIFALAFAVGMLSTASFSRIPDAAVSEDRASKPRGLTLRAVLADRRFLGFALSAFVWNLALQAAAPFFNVYLVSRLGASAAMVGLLTAVSSVTTMLGQFLFGRLTDRKGDIWVQVLTGLLVPILPFTWMLVTRPVQVAFINIASGILWAGYNLATFNILLKLTPDDHRPEATAVYQTLVMASSVIGPLVGGALADHVGYNVVFVTSGVGRFLGTLLFVTLVVRAGPLVRLRPRRPGRAP